MEGPRAQGSALPPSELPDSLALKLRRYTTVSEMWQYLRHDFESKASNGISRSSFVIQRRRSPSVGSARPKTGSFENIRLYIDDEE